MFPASLPLDYVKYLDRLDHGRRTRDRPAGSRVRRSVPRDGLSA